MNPTQNSPPKTQMNSNPVREMAEQHNSIEGLMDLARVATREPRTPTLMYKTTDSVTRFAPIKTPDDFRSKDLPISTPCLPPTPIDKVLPAVPSPSGTAPHFLPATPPVELKLSAPPAPPTQLIPQLMPHTTAPRQRHSAPAPDRLPPLTSISSVILPAATSKPSLPPLSQLFSSSRNSSPNTTNEHHVAPSATNEAKRIRDFILRMQNWLTEMKDRMNRMDRKLIMIKSDGKHLQDISGWNLMLRSYQFLLNDIRWMDSMLIDMARSCQN
jgi:hypothetical protein